MLDRTKRVRLIPKEGKVKTFLEMPERTKAQFKGWCNARGITMISGLSEAMRFCIKNVYVVNGRFFNRNGK